MGPRWRPNPKVPSDRLRALRQVVAQRPEGLAERLIASLDDRALGVRRYALTRLCDLDEAAVPALLAAARETGARRYCIVALANTSAGRRSLGLLPDGGAKLLRAALTLTDLTDAKTVGLIAALVDGGSSYSLDLLAPLRQSRSATVRQAVASALRARGLQDEQERRQAKQELRLANAKALLGELLTAPVFSITVEMLQEVARLDDPRVVPMLQRVVGWRGMMAQRGVVEAARAALDRALAADAGVPDGALSHAAEPLTALGEAALSLWRSVEEAGDEP